MIRPRRVQTDPDAVDLLVFGPHPDDLEIGLGGTIARHAALGLTRRPVRSDGRRDGQQRHGRGAAARPRPRAPCSARRGARTCAGPIAGSARIRPTSKQAVAFIRRHRPRTVAVPYWSDRHPDHGAASELLTEAVFNAGLRRYPRRRRGVEGRLDLLLLHQRHGVAVVRRRRVRDTTSGSGEALDCHESQFQRAAEAWPTRV